MIRMLRPNVTKAILGVLLLGCLIVTSQILLSFGSTYDQNTKSGISLSERNIEVGGTQKLGEMTTNPAPTFVISSDNETSTDVNDLPSEECNTQNSQNRRIEGLPSIYMVTPTYRRAEQIPELTRTGQTLLHVKNLLWIVVEDAKKPSIEVLEYLARSGLSYVYLRDSEFNANSKAQMPDKFKKEKNKPRGVANRNAGLEWVKKNATEGVIYFGDDDNTYDLRIFEEIRWTKGVSMFPVGLVTKLGVSTPIIKNGKVIGFYDGWISNRKFPVDMAGFAVNLKVIQKNPLCSMPFKVGYEEDGFLRSLHIRPTDIEPKADNCTKILVWHTQTKKNLGAVDGGSSKIPLKETNLIALKKLLWRGV